MNLHHFAGPNESSCILCGRTALDMSAHLAFRVTPPDERMSDVAHALELAMHMHRNEITRGVAQKLIDKFASRPNPDVKVNLT